MQPKDVGEEVIKKRTKGGGSYRYALPELPWFKGGKQRGSWKRKPTILEIWQEPKTTSIPQISHFNDYNNSMFERNSLQLLSETQKLMAT